MFATDQEFTEVRASLKRVVQAHEPEGVIQNLMTAVRLLVPYSCEGPDEAKNCIEIIQKDLEESLKTTKEEI